MSYNIIHPITTPMKAAQKRKPTPGRYTLVASFPPVGLHDHDGDGVPDELFFAPTSGRCVQLDFVGPRGVIVHSLHVDIPTFIKWDKATKDEIMRFEIEFTIAVGLPYQNLAQQYWEVLKPNLEDDIINEEGNGYIPRRESVPL